MDELDNAILRDFSRDQVLLFGGTDPRVSAGDISQRLGVERSVIRRRIRAWEDVGFLQRFSALPSALLFGHGCAATSVCVPDAARKVAVLDSIGLIDGVLHAIEHVGDWIGVALVDDSAAAVDRRSQLIARVPGVSEVDGLHRWTPPAVTRTPTALEWRIIAALRAGGPRATLAEMAASVGVSVNTFHSHYQALVRGNAIWSVPDLDFTCWHGTVFARLIVTLRAGVSVRAFAAEATRLVPGAWPATTPSGEDGKRLAVLNVQQASVGRVEDTVISLGALDGIEGIETLYPKRNRVYDSWFDEKVGGMADRDGAQMRVD